MSGAEPGPTGADQVLPRGWYAVARSEDVEDSPRPVVAAGHPYVAFRPAPHAPVAVVAPRCPHRGVRLDAARLEAGLLECPYHGWRFDAAGRCVLVPSSGPDAAVPPRAHLGVPWGVREHDGTVWVAPVDPGRVVPGVVETAPVVPGPAGPVAVDDGAAGELLTNVHPGLAAGWHPVATADEVPADGGPLAVRLLGRTGRCAGSSDQRGRPAGSW